MLFCQDFYPAEEKEEQLERYFEAPKEDVTGENGKDEILHDPFEKEEDRYYLEKRVEKIMELIPEKVAINEAVELAKKFGGDEAPAFVNGILAKLIQKGN